jgi:tetratricopeptide (TPR) repeat protein
MFTARPYPRMSREALWMAILAILAFAIILLMSVKLAGAAAPQPPRLLPQLAAQWQEAIHQFRAGNFIEAHDRMQAVQDTFLPLTPTELPADRGMSAWDAIMAQARGQHHRAMLAWNLIDLPAEMRAWKHVAVAAMHLEEGRNDEAAEELATAQLFDPDNAVVDYYLGILHIQQADEAIDWPDYVHESKVRLVAYAPKVVPNTKGMYELTAMRDLQRAVEAAACMDRDLPLIPAEWTTEPELRPLVADLLSAIGATDFETNAHQMLATLFLDRGVPELAEEHLDQANDLGARVPFVYNDLGDFYEAEGRHADAARAYLKGVRNGPDRIGALMRFLQNAGDSLRRE